MATERIHTVAPSGADFTSLADCWTHLEGSHADITATGLDEIITINISGVWSSADAGFPMHYVTTDETNYVQINVAGDARHHGLYSTGHYRITGSNETLITIGANPKNVRFNGVQFAVLAGNANYQSPIELNGLGVGARYDFANCIFVGHGQDYVNSAISGISGGGTVNMWNCVAHGFNTVNDGSYPIRNSGSTLNIYSCVLIGGAHGINHTGGTTTAKNTYAGGSSTEDFYASGTGTLAKTNCASEDQSADDTGTGETATNCVAAAVPLSTATFTNVTGGSEDFHLVTGSALIDAGANTSGESEPLNFTTDIDGDTRTGTWDIGADEYTFLAVGAHRSTTVTMNW